MIYAFVTHDYTIKYVVHYSDTSMPLAYKLTAFWGGLDGSLLFWVVVLATFAAIAVRSNRTRHREMIGYVVATIMAVQVFFLALLIYSKNPFSTFLTEAPLDGKGLNPLLQNYWMVVHPPALYVGFVAATIPFAFGIGALASGRLDDAWLGSVRVWTLLTWFFLSLGLILGGRWAYEELGWGGYWGWDPVENAGLLPWFTATAFLHSVIIQEQRGMLKVWNLVLVVLTFFLTIFGTFMTRSGIVQSVHSFGRDNQLALLFVLFMAVIVFISMGLLFYRLPKLRSPNTFESLVSREFAFLLNNWILLGCALFVLFATMFPTISELINGERISVGAEFYNKWMTPFGLVLLFLSGAAPLLAYRRTTPERLNRQFAVPLAAMVVTVVALVLLVPRTRVLSPIFHSSLRLPISLINFGLVAFVFVSVGQEFWKGLRVRMRQTRGDPFTALAGLMLVKRRRYGGYIVHLGIAVMFFGFAGKAYETMKDFTVSAPGERFTLDGYTCEYQDLFARADEHMRSVTARVVLYEGDKELDVLLPERRKYQKSEQPTSEVAVSQHLDEDIYLVLSGYREDSKVANFRVYINPLIDWVWIGFGILILGTAFCLIPQRAADSLRPRRRGPPGGGSAAGRAALILLAVGGVSLGLAGPAHAQSPQEQAADIGTAQAPSYDDNRPRHDEGVGYAHQCRPDSETARALMKELVCMCGGCQRENIFDCKCGYAAEERCRVLDLLKGRDLSTDEARKKAYDDVIGVFVDQYGEVVLSTPRSKLSWMLPMGAVGGALIILMFLGRAWARRGREAIRVEGPAPRSTEADDDYAEILDDELRETD